MNLPQQLEEEKRENRKLRVIEIIMKKVKNNLDVLFNFELSDKEFKRDYGITKQELKEAL